MRYLYRIKVDGDTLKDGFLETVKNPIKETFKNLILEFKTNEGVRSNIVSQHVGFKPITLKVDTCTGLENMLGKHMTFILYNKKTQAVSFTLEGFPQLIDIPGRSVKFYVTNARVGI